MLDHHSIVGLRMRRQHLVQRADTVEYDALYRDTSPGQNVYWNGFGDPPSLTFRADFDDIAYNRSRQKSRTLLKGRFQGGNLGWIERADLELFAGAYRKPLPSLTPAQQTLWELLLREGPMNIQGMKEATGLLVKEITPVLHRLQEAFLIYEDQYDGEWDRGWYPFAEMFPNAALSRYTRQESLEILLQRFARRMVLFDLKMARSFYRLPERDIKAAAQKLETEGIFTRFEGGFLLQADAELLQRQDFDPPVSVFVLHRNDILVKANEHWLKEAYGDGENDILQYILVDGEFQGAVLGHFKNGPYEIENICAPAKRREAVMEAVYRVNSREHSPAARYNGEKLL